MFWSLDLLKCVFSVKKLKMSVIHCSLTLFEEKGKVPDMTVVVPMKFSIIVIILN